MRIRELGDFQDGGLKHNNPSRLACWELHRIWPCLRAPDVFLSLGTGSPPEVPANTPSHFRHVLLDGFIPRLLRSCMSKADGEAMWGEFLNSLDEKARGDYFRLNVPLDGAALIDDVDSMESLREKVRSAPTGASDRLETAKALLASFFFFQLECLPTHSRSGYFVEGSIRCRHDSRSVSQAMTALRIEVVDYGTDHESISTATNIADDICYLCGRYKKYVQFHVRHPSDTVSIYMQSRHMNRRKVSGFPQTLEWFITQQGLRHVYGRSDHGMPGLESCQACTRTIRPPKHNLSTSFVQSARKKRCRLDGSVPVEEPIEEEEGEK